MWLKDKSVSFIDWIGRYQIAQGLLSGALPVGLTSFAAIAGYLEGEPYMWIIMASSLTFMATVLGLLYVRAWLIGKSPENKMRYISTAVNADLVPINRKEARAQKKIAIERHISKAQLGVILRNDADFVMSVFLESAKTEVDGNEPPRADFPKPAVDILPGNSFYVQDHPIDMGGILCRKLEGHMDLVIKYGRPGKEHYTLKFKAKVDAMMTPEGYISGIYTHWDSEQVRT